MLGKKIKQIAKSDRILFTTPSHDRTTFVIPEVAKYFGRKYFLNDLSEINDLDNLAEPKEEILFSRCQSAKLLGVNELFYLVNGSTSGIIAAMMSALSTKDKVLVARNCHKSVLNGLILTGAEPVWFLPSVNEKWGIFDAVSPVDIELKLSENRDIKAVIITSPTYEGINSDIKVLSDICHSHNAYLIVDEAHGALKSFAPDIFGENAVALGADIAVQSLHKTCGAPNPCAILLSSGRIHSEKIQDALNLINTTSPSYPIIAAIEATISFLSSKEGQNKIKKLVENIKNLKNVFLNNKNIEFLEDSDITKIVVKINGLSGFDLSDILYDEFNIEDELTNNIASILLTGIGTSKYKLKKLEKALKIILTTEYSYPKYKKSFDIVLPSCKMTPREAFFAVKDTVEIEKSKGKICGELISEYPPGIPILMYGEKIREEHIAYLKNNRTLIKVIR